MFGSWNVRFSTRVSCFRAFGTFKQSLKNACFDESIMFQASFDSVKNWQNIEIWRELRVIALFSRCDNYTILQFLTRASRFKAILRERQINQNVTFDKSFAFQADFDPSKTWKKQSSRQQHHVSGLFWQGASVLKCRKMMRVLHFHAFYHVGNTMFLCLLS